MRTLGTCSQPSRGSWPESCRRERSQTNEHFSAPVLPAGGGGPFQFQIEDVFGVKGRGAVVTGRVLAGRVRVGERAAYHPDPSAPAAFSCRVEAIERTDPETRKPTHPQEADAAGPFRGRCALLHRAREALDFRPGGVLCQQKE